MNKALDLEGMECRKYASFDAKFHGKNAAQLFVYF